MIEVPNLDQQLMFRDSMSKLMSLTPVNDITTTWFMSLRPGKLFCEKESMSYTVCQTFCQSLTTQQPISWEDKSCLHDSFSPCSQARNPACCRIRSICHFTWPVTVISRADAYFLLAYCLQLNACHKISRALWHSHSHMEGATFGLYCAHICIKDLHHNFLYYTNSWIVKVLILDRVCLRRGMYYIINMVSHSSW